MSYFGGIIRGIVNFFGVKEGTIFDVKELVVFNFIADILGWN